MVNVLKQSLMITSFVFIMMLLIEYLNVLTRGRWQEGLADHLLGQYVLAAVLGALPGCLGAFAVVSMYSHGVLTLGAVVTAMISTSGDEAFVMFAMFPKQAFYLTGILFILGFAVGGLTDCIVGRSKIRRHIHCNSLEIHEEGELCVCFPLGKIAIQWQRCSAPRGILTAILSILIISIILGQLGPPSWTWIRITLLAVSAIALFIVSTVPDHFLEEHLWNHVVKKHIPRVFLWILGASIVTYVLTEHLNIDLETTIRKGRWVVLLVACLVGLIPESGPHLIFVTFYARGFIPFSILLASSIVQDGHGMLPMLADSRKKFMIVKGINLAAGILFGALAMILGI